VIKNILVPCDMSSLAECALPHAISMATAFNGQLTLLHILEPSADINKNRSPDPFEWQIRKAEAKNYIDSLHDRLKDLVNLTESYILEGRADERIIDFAHEKHTDLIILNSYGQTGANSWNVSNVVQKVMARSFIPTLVVRGSSFLSPPANLIKYQYKRLLVGLDGSTRSEWVLPLATALAQQHGCLLILAHVVRKPELPHLIPLKKEDILLADTLEERNRIEAKEYLKGIQKRLPVESEVHISVSSNITESLHSMVDKEKVDLVLLSAHGFSGIRHRPFGNTALNFIAYGNTPLLVVQDLSPEEVKPKQASVPNR
jgi:nucleotide-binding universal stress UspA family protein